MKKKKANLDDIDVFFDPTPLTEEEKRRLSEYIQQDKAKHKKKSKHKHKLAA